MFHPRLSKSSESGFTLIEALLGVVVAGILVAGVAPIVVLSIGARVQARRVEQATQAGRSYIDGVRGGVISLADLPTALISTNATTVNAYFNEIVAPGTGAWTAGQLPDQGVGSPTTVPGIRIDTNNNGFRLNDPADLVIQPMRTALRPAEPALLADRVDLLRRQCYKVAVRVYRADAFTGSPLPVLQRGVINGIKSDGTPDNTDIQARQLTNIGTLGKKNVPLVVMQAQVFNQVTSGNIQDIQDCAQ